MYALRHWGIALATCLLFACSSSEDAAPAAESAEGSAEASGGAPATARGGSGEALAGDTPDAPAEGSASAENDVGSGDAPALPVRRAVATGSSSAMLSRAGGTIVAGGLIVEVQEGAISETEAIEAALLADAESLGRPLPGSLPLAALRTAPWNADLRRTVLIDVPLHYEVEEGTAVELLAYQPGMRAFIVVGRGTVNAAGNAQFRTRQLGDMIVRATPVPGPQADTHCNVERMAIHDMWPGEPESEVVGLTPEEHRMTREEAFSVLTDYRLLPSYERVDFKNEEVVDSGRTRRDERDHKDEDYLMDPAAALAVTRLAELVDAEWIDPMSGEPAIRVRITESYDSLIEHSRQSTHYQGRGIDLTLSPIPAASLDDRIEWYGRLSQLSVCAGFDYVLFENQWHVHASVAPTQVALARSEGDTVSVERASLARLGSWRPTGVQLPASEVEGNALEWDEGASAFALRTAPVGAAGADSPEGEPGMLSPDGAREVRVRDGRAFLIYRDGGAPIGSTNADGSPVDVRYPLLLDERPGAIQAAWDE